MQPRGDGLERVRLQPTSATFTRARGELARQQLPDSARRSGDERRLSFETHPAHALSSTAGTAGTAGMRAAARARILPVTRSGALDGVMWPTPGSSVTPRQFRQRGGDRPGVHGRGEPVRAADDDLDRYPQLGESVVEIEPGEHGCATSVRTARGQSARYGRTLDMSRGVGGAIVAYLRIAAASGVIGHERAGSSEDAARQPLRRPSRRSGSTVDSATSRELPVLHTQDGGHVRAERGSAGGGHHRHPAHGVPGDHGLSPGARVAVRTASRSSASASVLHAGLAGVRPWPRWS
ncbi:hypothetical protein GCM10023238_15180 [Streptomyces heliomycini]